MNRFYILFLLFALSFTAYSQQLTVLFDSGKAQLSPSDKSRLDSLMNTFETELFYQIQLIGHTDSIGSFKSNKLLSQKRAKAVQHYLSQKKNSKITVIAGESYSSPIQSNSTEKGRAQNRRCEIRITSSLTPQEQWKIFVQSFHIQNTDRSILYTKNGCKVIIEQGSFNSSNLDTITIHITEYNDPVDFIAGGLPMSYSDKGRTYMYQSEQMMKVEAFLDTIPLKLKKLIGLQCPHVDTSEQVRFYEFKGKEIKWANVSKNIVYGKVEVIQEETPSSDTIFIYNPELKQNDRKEKNINNTISISSDDTPADNKGPDNNYNYKKSILRKKRMIQSSKDSWSTTILPDTSKSFILEPDTSRGGTYYYYSSSRDLINYCTLRAECDFSTCDTASLIEKINYGLQFKNMQFGVPDNIDIHPYFIRYKSLNYDGMKLKCMKSLDELYNIKIEFKKRLLKKELALRIISAKDNPEYMAFKKTKLIVYYGEYKNKAKMLKNIKISDFRVHHKSSKNDLYIELKSDSTFYGLSVRGKNTKKTQMAYESYVKLHEQRIIKFHDSLNAIIKDFKVQDLFCLYTMTKTLSSIKLKYINCKVTSVPPCYPFSFFYQGNNTWEQMFDCVKLDDDPCRNLEFPVWIKYYNEHMGIFQNELTKLKTDLAIITNCQCREREKDTIQNPCSKWEYASGGSLGNKIIYIGLGIYNFDSEMGLEEKQEITNPIYLNQNGDTLFKCKTTIFNGIKTKECHHEIFTIIPGFNGLLKQNKSEILTLLPGKENMLYITNYNRKYKLYLDLRKVEAYKGNVFVMKDITEEGATLDGLKKELEKKK